MISIDPAVLLRAAFDAAVAAADPAHCLPRHLPAPPRGRTIVVGAGKAAAAMARAVDQHWAGPLAGLVVTAAGHGLDCSRIRVTEARHPLPDDRSERAAREILGLVAGLAADDLVICLLSGGGSALMSMPAPGVTLAEKQAITEALLRCGATIGQINCVRRHLSAIKGGRLAAACHPARLLTLAISDVPGDHPRDIASGPTVADSTTCAEAFAVLDRHRIELPSVVRAGLESGRFESIKADDPRLSRSEFRLVASPAEALAAAARVGAQAGIATHVLSDRLEGEARELGRRHAALVEAVLARGEPVAPPCLLLSGGEATVTVRGAGRGGRNVEFLLAFGLALGRSPGVYALAADTDGVDGTEPVAGATWRPDSLERARGLARPPGDYLDANDAHSFFEAMGDSLVTGPTRTNVNDFRAVLVLPADGQLPPRTKA